jgi:hypothetical protein
MSQQLPTADPVWLSDDVTTGGSGFPLVQALSSPRRRTLHDIASGLVLIHSRTLTEGLGFGNMPAGGPPIA